MSKKVLLIVIFFGLIATYLGLLGNARWGDSTPPEISLEQPFELVGPTTPLVVRIHDTETGLRDVSIRIIHNLETFVLTDQDFPSEGWLTVAGGTEHEFTFTTIPYANPELPRRQGQAQIIITSRDYSWRNLFEGNSQRLEQAFTPQFTPPRVELISPPATIVQGGSAVVRYRVIPDVPTHGVKIGDAFFPGFPAPDKAGMFALVAFPYNAPRNTPIQIIADDGFGNSAMLDVDARIKPQFWRTRPIQISDAFIRKTVPSILAQTPELSSKNDLLADFLQVNGTLRIMNNQTISDLTKRSRPELLWKGAFRQLSGSQVEASFADHRQYMYNGKIVDTQDHLGFDLAVTKHYPVEASNYGQVLFAGYLGIYGNTIILDHGYGLLSLYAHLSSIAVKVGDDVTIGQPIGKSGTTGLAGGDHLHFSLILHGEQVNPTEWWDPFWVKTRIKDQLGLPSLTKASDATPEPEPPSKEFGPTAAPTP
ncbi:MAG: M23 family metallopeptidase [Nitrospirota bacterium]|nr:M23 family metallopeptidase [Nitrospirota bacterium]